MAFQIFIHHSNNVAGFVLKSGKTTISSGCVCGDFKGYTEPMLISLMKCFSIIPEGSEVEIYSPMILTIMTDCGTERCTDLRRSVRDIMKKYSTTHHKASRHDKRIVEAKKLAENNHKATECIESISAI